VPVLGKSHRLSVHIGVFLEKTLKFLFKSMIWIDGVEEINHHGKNIVNTIVGYGFVGKPCVTCATWKKGLYLQRFIP
jgi:hypothetical protein